MTFGTIIVYFFGYEFMRLMLKKFFSQSLYKKFLIELKKVNDLNQSIVYMNLEEDPYFFEFIFLTGNEMYIFIKDNNNKVNIKTVTLGTLSETIEQINLEDLILTIKDLKNRNSLILEGEQIMHMLINMKYHNLTREEVFLIYKQVTKFSHLFALNHTPFIDDGIHDWID